MNRLLPILSACLLLAVSACGPDMGDPANVTFASGLYLQDLVEGTGDEARAGRYLEVHYTGWLADGTRFDTSRDTNRPFALRLGQNPPQVIAGWEEGILGMKTGGTRRLVIPSKLGYGQQGSYPIPPNSVLVFDVELLTAR
jgi:FKBP-type peptidyl-prolyl cis-trans isomerase FkpA